MTIPARLVIASLLLPRALLAAEPAQLEVMLSVSGARLELDDQLISANATQSHQQAVSPGVHVLRVTKDGFQPVARRIEAAAGQVSKVEVLLVPAESGSKKVLTRIALQELQTSGDVDPRIVQVVAESLLAELRKLEKTAAVGMNEINEMLSFEQQRQLMGCEESSCLAEIGGALGVDQLLSGSLSVLGGTVLFSLRRTDLVRARVLGSIARRLTLTTGEELLAEIGPSIQELFPEFTLRDGRRRGASVEAARQLNPPPIPAWAFFTGVGLTLVAGGISAYSGVQFHGAQTEYRTLATLSATQPINGSELMAIGGRVESLSQQTNLALGVTAGLALVTGVGALFTDFWPGGSAPVAVLVPHPGGAAVSLAGRF